MSYDVELRLTFPAPFSACEVTGAVCRTSGKKLLVGRPQGKCHHGDDFRSATASAMTLPVPPIPPLCCAPKDEETAQYFLKASARVRQMRRSMRVQKKGVFKPEFEEGTNCRRWAI